MDTGNSKICGLRRKLSIDSSFIQSVRRQLKDKWRFSRRRGMRGIEISEPINFYRSGKQNPGQSMRDLFSERDQFLTASNTFPGARVIHDLKPVAKSVSLPQTQPDLAPLSSNPIHEPLSSRTSLDVYHDAAEQPADHMSRADSGFGEEDKLLIARAV